MIRINARWYNVTCPWWLHNRFAWWFWRRLFCLHGWHLFDEYTNQPEHILYCHACKIKIPIDDEAKP